MSFWKDLEKVGKEVVKEVERDIDSIEHPPLSPPGILTNADGTRKHNAVHEVLSYLHLPETTHALILKGAIVTLQEILDWLQSQDP